MFNTIALEFGKKSVEHVSFKYQQLQGGKRQKRHHAFWVKVQGSSSSSSWGSGEEQLWGRGKKFRTSQKARQGFQSVAKERGKERENVFLLSSNAERWTGLAVMHIRSSVSSYVREGLLVSTTSSKEQLFLPPPWHVSRWISHLE